MSLVTITVITRVIMTQTNVTIIVAMIIEIFTIMLIVFVVT